MIKLIGTYNIPEWAICYFVNGDLEGLTDEEIQEADKFWQQLLDEYDASNIILDTGVMDEEKYSDYFRNEIDSYPAFGRKLGACQTWRIPVYAEIPSIDKEKLFNVVVIGYNPLNDNKYEMNIFQNKLFCDEEEAETWAYAYFDFLNSFDYYICEADNSVIHIWE